MWQELYDISNEELVSAFQYAQENKPEGITYVYNEPFLENSERRKTVLEQLKQINKLLEINLQNGRLQNIINKGF